MRLTVLEQYARGVAHHDADEGARLLRELERVKWLLWHGNGHRARQLLLADLDQFNAMLAIFETGAHLELLVAQGRLAVQEQDGVKAYA